MGRNFQRRKEDFICGHCGHFVRGDGYTNHCPICLYSKHVDINPGDRSADCGGLMEPISLERDHGEERLTHRCVRCGFTRKNKVSKQDDFDALLALSRRIADKEAI